MRTLRAFFLDSSAGRCHFGVMINVATHILSEDEDIENAHLHAAVEEARAEDSLSHERVREWLLALAEGKRIPPPQP